MKKILSILLLLSISVSGLMAQYVRGRGRNWHRGGRYYRYGRRWRWGGPYWGYPYYGYPYYRGYPYYYGPGFGFSIGGPRAGFSIGFGA